jgi:hypothetical protein
MSEDGELIHYLRFVVNNYLLYVVKNKNQPETPAGTPAVSRDCVGFGRVHNEPLYAISTAWAGGEHNVPPDTPVTVI